MLVTPKSNLNPSVSFYLSWHHPGAGRHYFLPEFSQSSLIWSASILPLFLIYFHKAARVIFAAHESDHVTAHTKSFWYFPTAPRIKSELLGLPAEASTSNLPYHHAPPHPPCARQRGTRSGRTGFLSPANTAKPATPGSFTFCPLRLEFSSPLSLHGPPFLLSLDLGLAGVYSGHGIYSGSPSLSTVTKDDLPYYHTSLIPL